MVAKQHYKIGGMKDAVMVGESSEDTLDADWRKFLDQGGLGTRPDNDKRKE